MVSESVARFPTHKSPVTGWNPSALGVASGGASGAAGSLGSATDPTEGLRPNAGTHASTLGAAPGANVAGVRRGYTSAARSASVDGHASSIFASSASTAATNASSPDWRSIAGRSAA